MLKKILISVLSVLVFLILITGGFRYAVNICNDYLLPEDGSVTKEELEAAKNRTVDYLFAVDSASAEPTPASTAPVSYSSGGSGLLSGGAEYCAVIGTLVEENKYYYAIYDSSGTQRAYGEFGTSLETCEIHDIRTGAEEIQILCEEDGLCVLYSISFSARVNGGTMKISKKAEFDPRREEETLLKLILPDEKMEYIVAAGTGSAVLYTADGQAVRTYEYEPKNVITCGVLQDGLLILCGAASGEEDGHGFSYGFAEAFSEAGALLWSKKLLNEGEYVSAVMECQIKPNGNLGIYGRYFDYSESDFQMTSLEAERYDDFKIYGNGIDYYIYTSRIRSEEGGTVQSSAFLAELDLAGGETDMRVYSALNDFRVPSISQTGSLNKLNSAGEFLLTIAQAEAEDSPTYHLTIDGKAVEIPSNLEVFYDLDTSGGIYAYLAESGTGIYRMKYFASAEDFSSAMLGLRRALSVSSVLDRLPEVLPWFVISVIGIILLAAKHKWRYSRGDEEDC